MTEETSSQPNGPVDADAALADSEAAIAQIAAGLVDLERTRAAVRPEDWETLFRQMQTLLTTLATHPFVTGDLEAEHLIAQLTQADDLEEFDKRVDAFADYALRKLQFNAALKEAQTGEVQAVPTRLSTGSSSSEATRSAAAAGPSGSDFDLDFGRPTDTPPQEDTTVPAPRRRGVLRL